MEWSALYNECIFITSLQQDMLLADRQPRPVIYVDTLLILCVLNFFLRVLTFGHFFSSEKPIIIFQCGNEAYFNSIWLNVLVLMREIFRQFFMYPIGFLSRSLSMDFIHPMFHWNFPMFDYVDCFHRKQTSSPIIPLGAELIMYPEISHKE